MIELSILFADSWLHLDDGDSYQIIYLHKGFAFVIMDEQKELISFIPLKDEQIISLLNSVGCESYKVTSESTIKMLDETIIGLDRDSELKKLR